MHSPLLPSQIHFNNVFPSYMQNSDEYLQHPRIDTTGRKKILMRRAHPNPASVIILKMLPKQIVLAAVAWQPFHCSIHRAHVKWGCLLCLECAQLQK